MKSYSLTNSLKLVKQITHHVFTFFVCVCFGFIAVAVMQETSADHLT